MTELPYIQDCILGCIRPLMDRVKEFYTPKDYLLFSLCRTLENEDFALQALSQQALEYLHDAFCEGCRQEGFPYPQLIWAEYLGTELEAPLLPTLRSDLPEKQELYDEEKIQKISQDKFLRVEKRIQKLRQLAREKTNAIHGTPRREFAELRLYRSVGGTVVPGGQYLPVTTSRRKVANLNLRRSSGDVVVLGNQKLPLSPLAGSRIGAAAAAAPSSSDSMRIRQINTVLEYQITRLESVLSAWLSHCAKTAKAILSDHEQSLLDL